MSSLLALPGLTILAGWSGGIALTWLLLPQQPMVGVVALLGSVLSASVAVMVRPMLLGLALTAAFLGAVRAELPPPIPNLTQSSAALAGTAVHLVGVVSSEPTPAGGGFQFQVRPAELTTLTIRQPLLDAGEVVVFARGESWPEMGDTVQVEGKLRLPQDHPGFNRRAYLAAQGVYLEMSGTQLEVLTPAGGGWTELPNRLRTLYEQSINRLLPQPAAALLLAIVLGVRKGIPLRLQQELNATGLIHLLVLSGLKVAIFARLINAALRPLLRRFALPFSLSAIGIYCLAGGATPAALRASLMGGIALLAQHLGRPTHLWTALTAAAAALLGWEPRLLADVGFQLSFLGTVAIVLFTPPLDRRLGWLPRWFREPFAVTVAAQLGTLPLIAGSFHIFSVISPVANALILPLLPLIVAGGLLLAPLAMIPSLGQLVALPLAALLQYICQLSGLLTRVPGSSISLPLWSPWMNLTYYLALLGGVVGAATQGRRRKAALTLTVIVPLAIIGFEVAVWARPAPMVIALEVGSGQAMLINAPRGRLLIDGGSNPTQLISEIGSYLPPWQHQLSAVIITGPAAGEVGGLVDLPYKADYLLMPASNPPGSSWRTAAQSLTTRGAELHKLVAGTKLQLVGIDLEVLAPEPDDPVGGQLMLRLVGPLHTVCVMAVGIDTDQEIQAASRLNGSCDSLVVAAGSELSPTLLAQARPHRVVISGALPHRSWPGIPPDRLISTTQEGDVEMPL
ncbi:MAG: ComEC/Rec2 family competence protein [Candidatus Dormibacteraceae bacterium]